MIRQMRKEDLDSVKTLMQSIPGFWYEQWNKGVLEQAVSASGDLALVCELDQRIVGFVFGYDLGFRAYLGEFAVAENVRGRGIGRRLLEHVQAILKNRGRELIISDVWKSAVPFYEKLGWREPEAVLLGKKLIS